MSLFLAYPIFAQDATDTPEAFKPEVGIGGYLQFHWIFDGRSGKVPNNEFLLRRARFKVEPEITRQLSGSIEVDVGRSRIAAKDAYIEYKLNRAFQFTFGQHKMPFSREELLSASRIFFIDRTEVNNAFEAYHFLGRDIGISIRGKLYRDDQLDLEYHVGMFNGNGTTPEYNNAKQYSERLTLDISKTLSFGFNSTQRTDSIEAKVLTAHGVEISFRPGDFVLEGELLYGNTTLDGHMVGWYTQAYSAFSGVELGLRYEKLLFDVHNSVYRGGLTGEIGYIISSNFRLRLNVEHVHPSIGDSYGNVFTQVQVKF